MPARRSSRFSEFFGIVRSAIAVSAATESGRAPRRRDLERLGIDPAQYRSVRSR